MLENARRKSVDIHVSDCDSTAKTNLVRLPARSLPLFRTVLPAVHSCMGTTDRTDTEVALAL